MRHIGLVATCLVLLLMLATLPDTAIASVAFGLVLTAVVVTAQIVGGRTHLSSVVFGNGHGPGDQQRRLRGSFRRQQRPDEAGRPMPRAPGVLAGAL